MNTVAVRVLLPSRLGRCMADKVGMWHVAWGVLSKKGFKKNPLTKSVVEGESGILSQSHCYDLVS